MTKLRLVLRSIKHYFKSELWLAFGVAITTAVLTGGLIVGDSVKYSLQKTVELRLGEITHAVTSGDRFFTTNLADKLNEANIQTSAALKTDAVASSNGGQLKINKVSVWGLDENFTNVCGLNDSIWNYSQGIYISENTALRLNLTVGDDILLRLKKASVIPANAPFVSDEDQTISHRAKVGKILNAAQMGRLGLQNSQTAPYNVFMSFLELNRLIELADKANVMLINTSITITDIKQNILKNYTLADAALKIKEVAVTDQWEVSSERVFIGDNIIGVVENTGFEYQAILTYFVNGFINGESETPYSFISTLPDFELDSNEIIINNWLAEDLGSYIGDTILLKYYNIGVLRELKELSKHFVVKRVVPIQGYFADQSLMPNIPGLSDSESCRDWQTGVPVNLKSIRDKDEDYWYNYRGLPKAFVSFTTAKQLWKNRFGSVTAFRFNTAEVSKEQLEQSVLDNIDPFLLEMKINEVKKDGLYAAQNGTDFSQLFIGLSFFILVAGIILTTLLFRFNLENRISEIGTLSSLGFSDRKILSIFTREGIIVTITGALLGLILAIGYNKMVFWGLNQVWNDIVRTQVLVPKIEIITLLIGFTISLAVSMLTIYLTLRKKLKQTTISLQRKISKKSSIKKLLIIRIIAYATLIYASITVLMELVSGDGNLNSGSFFMAGGLLLLSFILFTYLFLQKEKKSTLNTLSIRFLISQNIRLNQTRSLSVIILLAIGSYLVVSTGLNRQDLFSNAHDKTSGTGGYLFWAETTAPVLHNLNDSEYRKEQGFVEDFRMVQMRVADGDDASCLNLNRISNPRILGVNAELLKSRFTFQTNIENFNVDKPWLSLKQELDDCIPAIADQTVIQWGLGKKVGDTLVYQNSLGEQVKLLLVAGLSPSIFQGNIIIDNSNFLNNFPASSGSNVFLVDGHQENQQAISDELNLNFRDLGIEITSTAKRLTDFKSVENTYLSIFLILGALGLLIGTIGLAIVLQQSLIERKSEFALLSSLGFKQNQITRMVVFEYSILLVLGIFIGFITALISVFPVIFQSIGDISIGFVSTLILIIIINGIFWIVLLAIAQQRKMNLVESLRNE